MKFNDKNLLWTFDRAVELFLDDNPEIKIEGNKTEKFEIIMNDDEMIRHFTNWLLAQVCHLLPDNAATTNAPWTTLN